MISNAPLLSIVTPCLNAAKTLQRAIESVLSQDYPRIEYIIVDGGSTDGSLQIIQRYAPRLASWSSQPDQGVADAFNKGIAASTGEIIGIVNADDYYEPGILTEVAAAFAGTPGDFILHGRIRYYDERSSRVLRPWPWPRLAICLDLPFNHPSYFVPRKIYQQIGVYDTSYRIAMDFDFTARAMRRGIEFRELPRLVSHFQRGGLAGSNVCQCHREVRRAQRVNGLNPLLCSATFAAKMMIRSTKRLLGAARG